MSPVERSGSRTVVIFGGIALLVMFATLADVSKRIGPASIPIWFAALGAAAWVLRGPLGQAIARQISGETTTAEVNPELHEGVYAELDDLRVRVGELEERIDFSERLLAQRSQQGEGS